MAESETGVTFIINPEGEVLSSHSIRLPATHILINPVAKGPIPVNQEEFQGEKERRMMVPLNQWLKDHPDAKITKMTLDQWRKVKG